MITGVRNSFATILEPVGRVVGSIAIRFLLDAKEEVLEGLIATVTVQEGQVLQQPGGLRELATWGLHSAVPGAQCPVAIAPTPPPPRGGGSLYEPPSALSQPSDDSLFEDTDVFPAVGAVLDRSVNPSSEGGVVWSEVVLCVHVHMSI